MDFSSSILSGSSAPVVAVHCSASSPRQWDAYARFLGPARAFIAPSLLGYDAGEPWVPGSGLSLAREADRLLASCPAEPLDWVGHSYGGAVALQAALLAPERVRTLTLYEPTLFWLLLADARCALEAHEIQSVAQFATVLSRAGDQQGAAALFVDYWSEPGTWGRMRPARQESVARYMPKVCAEFSALFACRIRLKELQDADFPIRVLCGNRSPASTRRIAGLLAFACPVLDVVHVAEGTHMSPVSDPELIAPLLMQAAQSPLEYV